MEGMLKPKTKLGQAIVSKQKSNLSPVSAKGLASGKGKGGTFVKKLDQRLSSLLASRPVPSKDLPNQGPTELSSKIKGTTGKVLASPVKSSLKGGVAK